MEYLTREISWINEQLSGSSLRQGPPSDSYADKVFGNEISIVVNKTRQNYQDCRFGQAINSGFHDLQCARNWYIRECGSVGMNHDLVWRFVDVQTRIIAPICPHYAEYVWKQLLNKEGFVVSAGWPAADAPADSSLQISHSYLKQIITNIKRKLNRSTAAASSEVGFIYVNEEFDGWKADCLRMLENAFVDDQENVIQKALMDQYHFHSSNFCTHFLNSKKRDAIYFGAQVLEVKQLPFGEVKFLQENLNLIERLTCLKEVQILSATNAEDHSRARRIAEEMERMFGEQCPTPGKPTVFLLHEDQQMKQDLDVEVWKSENKCAATTRRFGDDDDDAGNKSRNHNLACLYRPPLKLLFLGSFEKAKEAACVQDKWLLVNLQSAKQFSSHMLNRDTWANEAVSQMIRTNFMFWQAYDHTDQGRRVCNYYKSEEESEPLLLIIDPITGQKVLSWSGMVQPERLLEDLIPFLDSTPRESSLTQTQKSKETEEKETYSPCLKKPRVT